MIYIVGSIFLILILTTLRAVKVRSFKTHLLIDGVLSVLMLFIVILRKFAVGTVICWAILLVWIAIGTLVRKYYSKFDFWFMNKMCKLFKMPQYKSIEEVEEDSTHNTRFSTELYYYAVEVGICVLIAFVG